MEDGTDSLIQGERNMLFKDLEIGDKVILESVIENNSMTLSISKQEEPKLVTTTRTGVGKSYERMLENSFVIDTEQETEESFVEKLKEAKGQKENIIILGAAFLSCSPMITSFMKSGLKATVIIEDIQRVITTAKLG
jgi:adenylosuccinate synthase